MTRPHHTAPGGRAGRYVAVIDDAEKLRRALLEGEDRCIVGDPAHVCDLLTAEVRRLRAERGAAQGHDEPCYYCGEPCNALAGNPGLWPIPLCHADDPGRVKWHHTGCVTQRLEENQPVLRAHWQTEKARADKATAERDALAAALKALAHRHGWQPDLGPCVCDEHRRAAELLGDKG